MWYFLLVFFLGLSVGSFVNVLIDRSMRGLDWVRGKSQCDFCGNDLAWYELVPLISYCCLGGKSRCCRRKLSLRHPLIELLFGALFVWWLLVGFAFFRLATTPLSLMQPVFWLAMGTILTILALTDLLYGVILMNLVWTGMIGVGLYRVILVLLGVYQIQDFALMVLAGISAYLFFWILRALTRGRGMGDGDSYLVLLTTMIVGWQRAGVAILSAFIVGAVVGIVLIMTGKRKRNESVPFGPFIVAGVGIALVWGETINRFLVLW